jgi:uroporphyrinogen decarboxylase
VLAAGTPQDVARGTEEMLRALDDHTRLVPSCGGGMPPGVKTENVDAFIDTVDRVTA